MLGRTKASNPSAPRALTVPRAEAESRIAARIDKGRELLELRIAWGTALNEASTDRLKWDKYNVEMLRSLFDSTRASEEYGPVRDFHGFASEPGPPTIDDLVGAYRGYVITKIGCLESIIERLELYEEPAPLDTGASLATAQQASAALSVRDYRELEPSLDAFRADHPDPKSCVFLMMKYRDTPLHVRIAAAIRGTCSAHGLEALRADDKRYSDDLLPNVRTYMHGCDSGIAVLERLTEDDFNPNVSLEVGYMMAQAKPVCLLKDKTLTSLQTDLLGRLYDAFDTQDPEKTIPPVLEKWLKDKGLV